MLLEAQLLALATVARAPSSRVQRRGRYCRFVRVGGSAGVHSGGGAKQVMADDSDYFTCRAIEEEKFAAAAASVAARARHEELALLYWSLANGAAAVRLPIIADAVIRPGDFAL